MAGTIIDLVLLSTLLAAVGLCAVAPVGFMGVMLWRWHKELAQLRQPSTIRPKAPPRTVSVRPSMPSLSVDADARLDRLAS